MAVFWVGCTDGTEPNCLGELEVEAESQEEANDQAKKCEACAADYDDYDVPCDDRSDPNCWGEVTSRGRSYEEAVNNADVCGACGSDYTRDPDGNIIV